MFAEIAGQAAGAARDTLVEPAPPVLPARYLPTGRSNAKAVFRPRSRRETPVALAVELARLRRRHAKYLRNLAPDLPSLRQVLPLQHFNWRIETPDDQQDFSRIQRGEGGKRRRYDG